MESPSSFVRPTSEVLPAPLPVGRAATYGGHVIEDGEGFVSETLAVRLRSGDPEALSEAYRHHSRLVYSLALRGLGVPHDAEDATQQVFVSAWRGRHGLDPNRGSLAGWLVGITRNVVADMHAQRARTTRNLLAVGSRVEPPDPPLDAAVVAQVVVAHALDGLGEPRRTIVRLAIMEEHTHEEISASLGLALGTVKSHVRRGLLQLRRTLEEVRNDAS